MMSEPRRLHPLAMLFTLVKLLRNAIIPIIGLIIASLNDLDQLIRFTWLIWVIVGLVFVVTFVLPSVVSWYRFTYRVEDGELKIEHGAFVKKHRYIRKERIQSIDHTVSIFHRPFGLVKVRIETAGGTTEPEAELSAVRKEEALKLEELLYGNGDDTEEEREGTDVDARRKLTTSHLLLAGATSGKIGVVLSIVAAIFSQAGDLLPEDFYSSVFRDLIDSSLQFIAFLLVGIAIIAWGLAIAATVIKYAGFTLTRTDEELQISYGLLERRRVTIELRRVQAVRIVEGVMRQPFGFAALYLESAGGSGGKDEDFSTILFPLLPKEEVASFLDAFVPGYPIDAELTPVPNTALRHYLMRLLIPVLIITVPVAVWVPFGTPALLLLPLAAILGFMQYRTAGWAMQENFRILRFRGLARTTVVVPRKNIQAGEMRQSLFQRRSGLATYQVSVISRMAGKNFRVAHLREDDVQALVHIPHHRV